MRIKTILLGVGQAFILFLIGVYIESIASEKLLLTEGILAEGLRKTLLDYPKTVLFILGIINVSLYVFSHGLKESKEMRNMYNNICQLVFDEFVTPNTTIANSKYRVSFFKAKKGFLMRQDNNFVPEIRTYLKNVGRYQTRQEKKHSSIKFLPNEGVVGQCYAVGEILKEKLPRNAANDSPRYLQKQLEKFNLPNHKAKKLQDNSLSYLASPIKYFGKEKIYGVIIIDSQETNGVDNIQIRDIEDMVANYSVFFNSNDK